MVLPNLHVLCLKIVSIESVDVIQVVVIQSETEARAKPDSVAVSIVT